MSMIKVESIADGVKKYLEQRIFTGKLKPGQQIKEQEVAESLGVSRPPIREALKILEAEGLITRRPNKGAFVTEIDEKDIWEIYTLKTTLYGLGTRLAFDRLTDSIMRKLDSIISKMKDCIDSEPPDISKYQNLNEQFHNMLLDAAGHGRLKKMASTLHNQVKRFSYRSLAERSHLERSYAYHKAILEAIKKGEREKAAQLTEEHVLEGLKVLQAIVRRSATPQKGGC
ncbi:MAG: GntR family transcriptional regulator [Deltaproteobacteria bacterium]|nr:GntR family transcriptional regulator [Deltaproteobacteria bacterium]MBW1929405.1 GntR family transcriptional regulator [Deltaproteobacteria bacterium]MBW2025551.1 GntR family transcriptional regulator [Deltaproteobacteria bacterium]MBW2126720.1 GntR family transcriptional regulator [Deltaproteobacteria bacterium]RLB21762.1 MAG: hypothetical protein DRG76_08315 [Deltaproteobacteria bacterium]